METIDAILLDHFAEQFGISRLVHAAVSKSHTRDGAGFKSMSDTELMKVIAERARELAKENGVSIPADVFFQEVGKVFRNIRKENPIDG